ncbi:MAG: hypothetical protein M1823_006016 [Watsoniomyces obsoletus]|nr:MAG: hypothetical protein M1823_006016 [Watsoniomyces obsoletus]
MAASSASTPTWISFEIHPRVTAEEGKRVYHSFAPCLSALQASAAENIAEFTFFYGRDAFNKREYEEALDWFEKSYSVFKSQNIQSWSPKASRLQMFVLHGIAMLGFISKDAAVKAQIHFDILEKLYGGEWEVHLSKIDSWENMSSPKGSRAYLLAAVDKVLERCERAGEGDRHLPRLMQHAAYQLDVCFREPGPDDPMIFNKLIEVSEKAFNLALKFRSELSKGPKEAEELFKTEILEWFENGTFRIADEGRQRFDPDQVLKLAVTALGRA